MTKELTAEVLREMVEYDPETGIFRWRITHFLYKKGKVVGYPHHIGYWRVFIFGRHYGLHRLAWLYVYGEWPPAELDHIDSDRANNRIANLRPATTSQNQANRGPQRNNTSGYKGVYWSKRSRTYCAQIGVNGRKIYLGHFKTAEEAHDSYCAAVRQYHGEFGRVE